ncbi:hypothetical protein IKQ21_09265 [bacterium]|nr:hypothetical protein [bacterium]
MKKNLFALLLLFLSVSEGWYSYTYLTGKWLLAGIFVCGLGVGMFLMFLKLNVKNNKLNLYKRELEKESIVSDESSARVKVLEQKIEVLEKALENALNK